MTDQEILDAIRASGVTGEQLTVMLTKFVILMTVEEKRAELARAIAEMDAAAKEISETTAAQIAPYTAKANELRAQLADIERQAAAAL
jgi:mono/diheme cytochrome c family protein